MDINQMIKLFIEFINIFQGLTIRQQIHLCPKILGLVYLPVHKSC